MPREAVPLKAFFWLAVAAFDLLPSKSYQKRALWVTIHRESWTIRLQPRSSYDFQWTAYSPSLNAEARFTGQCKDHNSVRSRGSALYWRKCLEVMHEFDTNKDEHTLKVALPMVFWNKDPLLRINKRQEVPRCNWSQYSILKKKMRKSFPKFVKDQSEK